MGTANRILIVEDEPVVARNLKTFFDQYAADVRIAPDGQQAIDILESFAPDVIVLDYRLPRMNGLDTYSEIVRRHERPVGCVMITAYPLETIAEDAGRRGIRHMLCKPFSLFELQRMVELSAEDASHHAH